MDGLGIGSFDLEFTGQVVESTVVRTPEVPNEPTEASPKVETKPKIASEEVNLTEEITAPV